MDNHELVDIMAKDEAYRVLKSLAEEHGGSTEIVLFGNQGPLVRKRLPLELANREAWETLAQIHDDLIPKVFDIYELPDSLTVVYEYIEGEPLNQMMNRRGLLLPEEAVRIISNVAEAAEHLHIHGLVHRDISPGNVIITAEGARLTDLGIARVSSPESSSDTTHLGTWGFAAPEQYGFAQTDARSDVWSMGRLLAYMLTGLRPDEAGFEERLADEAFVPYKLAEVIKWACAFEPSSRYESAEDFRLAVLEASSLVVAPAVSKTSASPSFEQTETAGNLVESSTIDYESRPVAPITNEGISRKLGISDFRELMTLFPNLFVVKKVLLILLWLFALLNIAVLVNMARDTEYTTWGPFGDVLFSGFSIAFVFVSSLEIQRFILGTTRYAGALPLRRCLILILQLVKIAFISLTGLFAAYCIGLLVGVIPSG